MTFDNDQQAVSFLQERGYTRDQRRDNLLVYPTAWHVPAADEQSAINFLFLECDYNVESEPPANT
jgi:hypothetical protein